MIPVSREVATSSSIKELPKASITPTKISVVEAAVKSTKLTVPK